MRDKSLLCGCWRASGAAPPSPRILSRCLYSSSMTLPSSSDTRRSIRPASSML
jgi:hypothetical protein